LPLEIQLSRGESLSLVYICIASGDPAIKRESLSLVYICIASGDPVIKRAKLGSNEPI
jgi:hypothetical protein